MSAPRVLIILHQEHSTPGRVGRLLAARGCDLDIRRPRFGDPLPETLGEHAGVVVFGGPMSANDPDDFVRREVDWLAVPLAEEKPFLGICLGAQMLARHLGARVYNFPDESAEIGYYPIRATEAGAALCQTPFPDHVYQWHRDGFELPAGSELLASGDERFPNQAFRVGPRAYGLQFHPEVTYAMICRWTTRAAHRLVLPGARPRDDHLSGWYWHDRAVAEWSRDFLRRWLDGAPQGDSSSAQ